MYILCDQDNVSINVIHDSDAAIDHFDFLPVSICQTEQVLFNIKDTFTGIPIHYNMNPLTVWSITTS